MGRRIGLALTMLVLALWGRGALAADCATPSGNEGDVIYNSTYKVVQFCNGTDWVNAGSSGAINVGTLTNGSFCTTDGSVINCTTATISLTSQVSGTLQAAQFPALTGDVTTSAGSLATTIASGAVTNAMLAGSIAASKLVGTDIATVGTITSGVWNAGAVTSSGTVTATSFSGSGASLTNLNADNLASGTVPTARLGSGTANSSTYLRGDQTWVTVEAGSSPWTTSGSAIYYNSGNVGIGTTSPSYKLDVMGAVRANLSGGAEFAADGSSGEFRYYQALTDGVVRWDFGADAGAEGGANAGSDFFIHRFADNGTWLGRPLTIQRSTGNIGIGTTAPGNVLHVERVRQATVSSANAAARIGGNDVYTFMGSLNTGPWGTWIQTLRPSDDAPFPLALNPNGGNVGIGTNNPGQKLDVTGNIRASGEIISTNANPFRMVHGNYGAFFRNDGNSLYLLLTNSGDQYGGWNSLRPFRVNLASGAVTMEHNTYVSIMYDYNNSGYYVDPNGTSKLNNLIIGNDQWHASADGKSRILYTTNGHNYYRVGGNGSWFIFRNSDDTDKVYISGGDGNIWMAWLGDWISNRIGQDVRSGAWPVFNGFTDSADDVYYVDPSGTSNVNTLYAANAVWGWGRTETRDNAGLRGDAGALSGFFQTASPTNYPSGASSWWHLIDVRHSNTLNNYALQIAGSFFDQNLYYRKTNDNPTTAWKQVVAVNQGGTISTSQLASGTASSSTYLRGDGTWAAPSAIPSGLIAAFASTSCPAGWSEYTAARGRFLRGIDNGAGNDPDGTRTPGATQADAQKGLIVTAVNGWANLGGLSPNRAISNFSNPGGTESRPKNVAVLFCRKN